MARNTQWGNMSRYNPAVRGPNLSPTQPGYFDPTHRYGSGFNTPAGFGRTGAGKNLFNQNPEAAYGRILAQGGVGQGSNPFDQFVQGEYGNINNAFQQAQLTSPNLDRRKFMAGLGANPHGGPQTDFINYLRTKFLQQSAAQRGEDQATYGAGPGKWLAF